MGIFEVVEGELHGGSPLFGGFLEDGAPAVVVDGEEVAETEHESGDGQDGVLGDGHVDEDENAEAVRIDAGNFCPAIAFFVHEFGEVVGFLLIVGIEGEIDRARSGKDVAALVALCEQVGVCDGGFGESIEHVHWRKDSAADGVWRRGGVFCRGTRNSGPEVGDDFLLKGVEAGAERGGPFGRGRGVDGDDFV